MQKLSMMIFFSLLAMSNITNAEGKKIVKWVDSKGVTQYGDKLPASEAGRNNAEMNTQGMVLKKNVAADKSNEALDLRKLEQERKDKILLASYTKAEEIDLAKERNLELDKASLQSLGQQKINLTNRTARNNKLADGFKVRKKPVPTYLSDELKLAKAESANIDKQMAQRKLSMVTTNTRYTDEKARFIALKQPIKPTQPTQPAQSATPAGSVDAATSSAIDNTPVKDVASTNLAKPYSAPVPLISKK